MVGPPIIAMCNQKGGVGKTSCTLLSASSLSRRGFNVLVFDMDQQANATTAMLEGEPQTAGVFGLTCDPTWPTGGRKLSEVIEPAAPQWGSVDVVSGSPQLALVDTDMDPTQPNRLRRVLRQAPDVLGNYDVVLMDCPPAVGRVMFAALVAATHFVIVSEPTGASVEGMGRIENTVLRVRDATEWDTPELLAVLINRMRRTKERETRLAEIRAGYGEAALCGEVWERAAVDDAYSTGQPIHAMTSTGARAVQFQIDAMWDQLADRLRTPRRPEVAAS